MQHSLFIIGSQMSLFFLCISFQNMMTNKITQTKDIFYSLQISSMTDNLLWRLVNKLLVFRSTSFLLRNHANSYVMCRLSLQPVTGSIVLPQSDKLELYLNHEITFCI